MLQEDNLQSIDRHESPTHVLPQFILGKPVKNVTKLFSLSNQVYRCQLAGTLEVLIYKRYFQTLYLFCNRQFEAQVLKKLASCKMYPKILEIKDKYRVQEFVEGEHPTEKDLYALLKHLVILAKQLKVIRQQLNSLCPSFELRKLLPLFADIYRQATVTNSFKSLPISMKHQIGSIIDQQNLLTELESAAKLLNIPLSLCHNDLHCGNILKVNKTFKGSEQFANKDSQLVVLDFEFCALNYLSYDLSNFLNETFTTYTETKFEIHEWPLSDEQVDLITERYFVEVGFGYLNRSNRLAIIEFTRLLSHLFWLFVGIKQIDDKRIGFDMKDYVCQRFKWFQKSLASLRLQLQRNLSSQSP